jgi:DNA-binding transcriptional ArsR family regulator
MLINNLGNYMINDSLSVIFAALADPTRRSILAQLTRGEATVNELAAPHSMSLPAISRHLKVLEKAGLVVKGREAQWRPCRLEVAPLRDIDTWMAPYRDFFERRFDRLEEHLKTMVRDHQHRPATDGKPARKRTPRRSEKESS